MKRFTQNISNKFIVALLAALLALSNHATFAKVSAKVDRQYAYEGETITLSIKAENSPGASEPDFSPLVQDFHIGGTSQSSSISIINGRSSQSQTWSVRLQPKKLGEIEIPALTVGSETTRPLKIEIKPIPVQSGASQGQPLFITLEIDSKAKHFYVQQHIPLAARLYYKHDLTGRITDPAAENALLDRLGDDINYTSKHNGQDYRVVERRYSLFAEKSGELHIPSVSFQGNMKQPQSHQGGQRRHDPFSQFFNSTPLIAQGQPVSIRSEAIDLTIEPHPTEFNGKQWLPAESLTLHDSWTDNPPVFRVGEPVSRTITLEAKGLVASQIKPLELPTISSFRRYAEPADTQTRTDGQNVYATSRRTFTYIPAFEGNQEIPALELPWWNVLTQKQETAKLAPWKINVGKSLDNTSSRLPPSKPAPTQLPANKASKPISEIGENLQPSVFQQFKAVLDDHIYWIAGAIISFLVILVLLANRKNIQQQPVKTDSAETATTETVNVKHLLQSFHQACTRNDASEVARTLLELAQHTWIDNPPRSIGALATLVDNGKQELMKLDQYLYSGSQEEWDGKAVCEAFKNGFQLKANPKHSEPALRPLYPEQ